VGAPPAERSWRELVAGIAAIARVDASAITPQTRLVEDLALDSLALTEVVVLMLVDFGLADTDGELEERDWTGVTIGAVFEELDRRSASA